MRRITILVAALLVPAALMAQLSEEWVNSYNGPYGTGPDSGTAVVVDEGGYVYACGYALGTFQNEDYITIKYDPSTGETLWVRYYNGPDNCSDFAHAIAVDNSGGVYVTGRSYGYVTQYDYATIKYDASDGDSVWAARYNGGYGKDEAYAIAVDNSGGVYVTGGSRGSGTYNDYATIKYNASDGGQVWAAYYNGTGNGGDAAHAIAVDNSGGVYVTGTSYGSGTYNDYATIKYDASDGSQVWAARYVGTFNDHDRAQAIAVDNSGGVYVTGRSVGSGTREDYATIKYDASDGDSVWAALYNGPGNSYDYAYGIAVDNSGGVYVTGCSYGGRSTNNDYATVKYDASDGSQVWSARYNGPGSRGDAAYAIAVDNSGGVYVTGQSIGSGTSWDYATIKYDGSDGDSVWAARYHGGYYQDAASAIALDNSGGVYVTGYSIGSRTGDDCVTIKYDASDGDSVWATRYNSPQNPEYGQRVVCDGDGYVYACGYGRGPSGNEDYITIKYNPSTGETLWVRYYNGPANFSDRAYAVAVDNSGGVYVTGRSFGRYTADYATIKYDASDGDSVWAALYNGPGGREDYAYAIAVDGSGNVYVTGQSWGSGTDYDYATIKYDVDGDQLWVARYHYHTHDRARAIALDNSGGVYVTGVSRSSGTNDDYATIKYNASDGDSVWASRYNGPGNSTDEACAIAVDNSGVYVTGYSYGSGTYDDYATIKYDASDGGRAWDVTDPPDHVVDGVARYNGPAGGGDWTKAIALDNSGGVYVTGYSNGSGTYDDYATIKYDASDGDQGWTARYNGTGNYHDRAQSIAVDNSGVYVTGYSYGTTTGDDYLTARYDPESGEEVDVARYDGSASSSDQALSIATDGAGSVYVTGTCYNLLTGCDIVTIKYLAGTFDVGVAEITEPSGLIDTLPEIPEALIQNFGDLAATFWAYFEITDSATGSQAYLDSAQVTGLAAGAYASVEFPEWEGTSVEGRYYSFCYTVLSGDADGTNDSAWSQFAVEAAPQATAMWRRWLDVPSPPPHWAVQHGAAMATDPLGKYVFLLKGNNTCEFYVCDPGESTWTTLEAIPLEGRDATPRAVREGGALAQVGGKYYATKGGNCLEFWEYDPEADEGEEWSQKADVPAGNAGVHSGASAAGVMVGDYAYVYLLKASSTNEYYRYNVSADTWEEMASAPSSGGETYKKGTSISYDGIDTIYVLKGIENDFHAYVVSEDEWLTRPELPEGDKKKQAKGGASIVYHNRNVWCLKGSNSQEFWVYKCDDGEWERSDDIPLGDHRSRVEDGGAMVYARYHRYLFATKGHSLEFWSYGKLTNYGIQGGDVVSLDKGPVKRFELGVRPSITRSRAEVKYALPKAGKVMVRLFDVSGRQAAVLADGWHETGRYTANVEAARLAQGIYLLKCETADNVETRKLVVQR